MNSIKFEIPGVPIPKARPRVSVRGTYTPKTTVTYKKVIQGYSMRAMMGKPPLEKPLSCELTFYMPIPKSITKEQRRGIEGNSIVPAKKPDLDNLVKAVFDGMNEIVYVDDAQIIDLSCAKYFGVEPMVVVEINEYDFGTLPVKKKK